MKEEKKQQIGPEMNKAPELIGIDLTAGNAAGMMAALIDEKLEGSILNTAERASILKVARDAIGICEPKFRAEFVGLLLSEFKDEATSGREFKAYGFTVCLQQVPTYNYNNDVKEARMAAEVEQLKQKYNAKAKALKGYREGLVLENHLKPESIDYRLRIVNK